MVIGLWVPISLLTISTTVRLSRVRSNVRRPSKIGAKIVWNNHIWAENPWDKPCPSLWRRLWVIERKILFLVSLYQYSHHAKGQEIKIL